jgi:hypothetical protein
MTIERVELKIIHDDGEITQACVDTEYGFQQWGQPTTRLGENVEFLEAVVAALNEHGG